MTKADCVGCHDNFYNGHNNIGVTECWHFNSTQPLVTRYHLSINVSMGRRDAYEEVKVPPCFSQIGFVFLKAIPDYAK